jgi:hypothetical protein
MIVGLASASDICCHKQEVKSHSGYRPHFLTHSTHTVCLSVDNIHATDMHVGASAQCVQCLSMLPKSDAIGAHPGMQAAATAAVTRQPPPAPVKSVIFSQFTGEQFRAKAAGTCSPSSN